MKLSTGLFTLSVLASAGALAQDYCAPVTEYVTVTAVEVVPPVPSSFTSSSSIKPVTENVPITTAESVCELSPVTLTKTLEPTTITIYPSSTGALQVETDCSLSTVWVTEDLEPTTITVYPDLSPSSSAESAVKVPMVTSEVVTVTSPSVEGPQFSFAPLTTTVELPSPTAVLSSVVQSPSQVVESPTFVFPSQAEVAATSSAPPAATSISQKQEQTTSSAPLSGQATFYGGNVDGGMCSFTGYTLPSGIFGTAISDSNWDTAEACGACVEVTGPSGNKITAMVVDQCPGCGVNHLDLFENAFTELADASKGVIDVSWSIVPCGITSPITLKNKSGASQYYFNIQVENSNVQVSKVEVSTDGGSNWLSTTRKDYNYFEISSGTGTDSVTVRITSVDGKTIDVKDVSCADSATKSAGSNF